MIDRELAAFLESGLSLLVGSCDARRVPEAMRGVALDVAAGGRHVSVFLPQATSRITLANLHATRRIAIAASHPVDHRTVQLKGDVVRIRPASHEEEAFVTTYLRGFGTKLESIGVMPSRAHSIVGLPADVVEVAVRELFDQTPGPGAGNPLRTAIAP